VYQKIEGDSASLPENKDKPQSQWKLRSPTADEQKILDEGMNARLPGAEENLMTQQTAPAVAAGQQVGQGNLRGAAGTLVGSYGPLAAGETISRFAPNIRITPRLPVSLDPAELAAVQFAAKTGVPIDAASATGNPVVRNVQGFLQNAPGSALVIKRARAAQTEALKSAGADIAAGISPAEATPEIGGTGVRQALESRIASQGSQASAAYDRLRQIENAPANRQRVTVGSKASGVLDANGNPVMTPVTQDVALPYDFRGVKQALKPIADEMQQQITPGQQQYSKALLAIRNILDGPDVVSASTADQNLSALKAIQREAPNAQTGWLATQLIKQYAPAVEAAVAKAGPEALDALHEGRQLTAAKYATKDTLDQLPTEPVGLFNKLTSAKDANINLVRDVASKAPEAMPAVGRAVVVGLMDKAFAEAGQGKPGSVLTEWQKLGPETKRILFKDPRTISNLDDFFTFAKKAAENPNPSGTAYMAQLGLDGSMLWNAPHLGVTYLIGKNALARMLTNPVTARTLTNGLTLPSNRAAIGGILTNQILQAAGPDVRQINTPNNAALNANAPDVWGVPLAAAGSR
jgi:hypothetical protein